jgi:hypothetical protein
MGEAILEVVQVEEEELVEEGEEGVEIGEEEEEGSQNNAPLSI